MEEAERSYFGPKRLRAFLSFLSCVSFLFLLFLSSHPAGGGHRNNIIQQATGRSSLDSLSAALCPEERRRVENVLNVNDSSLSHFYTVVMDPLQTACRSMKRIGGNSIDWGYEGGKYVCLDDLTEDEAEECLVYSFGLRDESSFEGNMTSKFGCSVRSYDRTVDKSVVEEASKHPDWEVVKKHVGLKASATVTTLEEELEKNGHTHRDITYLKMDIEGSEVEMLKEWTKTGLLKRVKQIGVEFHDLGKAKVGKYFDIVRGLYLRGFKIISWEPNLSVPAKQPFLMPFFEIVFRRADVQHCGIRLWPNAFEN